MLDAVSPIWRTTTAPYGPTFLGLARVLLALTGKSLVAGIFALRLAEIAGIALVAGSVPRLARALGTDPALATFLAAFSPLVLLELIAAGHNDALMAGLLVVGVTLAMEEHPLLGVACCALGASLKVPAAAGMVLVTIAWARAETSNARRFVVVAQAAAASIAILGVASVATGLGLGWISTSVISTPGIVHLAITPATALGRTLAGALDVVSLHVGALGVETLLGHVFLGLLALAGVLAAWKVRRENLVLVLAAVLLVAVLLGPALWPWYLTWAMSLYAACAGAQRSRLLVLGLATAPVLVKADGIFLLHLDLSPVVVVVAVICVAIWLTWRARLKQPHVPSAVSAGMPAGRRSP